MKTFTALFTAVVFLLTLGIASADENTGAAGKQAEVRPLIISKADDAKKNDNKTKKEKKQKKKKKKQEKKKKQKTKKNEGT